LTAPYSVLGDHTSYNTAGNLLGRWSHRLEDGGEWVVGSYLDYSNRQWPAIDEEHLTFDLDFQHRLAPLGAHELMWGAGFRNISDHFINTLLFSVQPTHYQQHNASLFFQDEITLLPDELKLMVGSKFEYYTLASFQIEPNIRLAWSPNNEHNLWAAISRAVALPNRYQRYFRLVVPVAEQDGVPVFEQMLGSNNLSVETVIAYELGWRYAPQPWLKFDTALFYNQYGDIIGTLQTGEYTTLSGTNYPLLTTRFGNYQNIRSYGVEIAADYAMTKWWRWKLAYTAMGLDDYSARLSEIPDLMRFKGTQPRQTVSLRSSVDLRDDVELDLWLRYAGHITPGAYPNGTTYIPSYVTMDARLAWQATPNLELSIVGRNLFDTQHTEYANTFYMPYQSEIERSVYFKAALRF
jgi:iron complex outermembrane receptor protein